MLIHKVQIRGMMPIVGEGGIMPIREDYRYCISMLGIENKKGDRDNRMGRKSPILDHAYKFALNQYKVVRSQDGGDNNEGVGISEVERISTNEK